MKITKLKIENFKAIKNLELNNLGNTVLIAGPNGCGKSCIFHAIRLLKSCIGGYQDNEWHLWFNEFQINPVNIKQEISKLFQSKDKNLKIEADFKLHDSEKEFLQKEGKAMMEYRLLTQRMPGFGRQHQYQPQSYRYRPFGSQHDSLLQEINKQSQILCGILNNELSKQDIFKATLNVNENNNWEIITPVALQLAFSFYEENLGIIDYHGPDRAYNKETLDNISLNIQTNRQSVKQSSLYNYLQKYANVKQEMAGDFIRKLLKEKAGGVSTESNLIDTLKNLFKEFFPGKEFLGPRAKPDGYIEFPVKLSNGTTHDINDLSSGEKEILYGYLRLRNSAPKNSIILLDEPELHLNPGLISGLPQFYKKYIGDALSNQIFLITHSDAFLREAVKEKSCQVFHMRLPFSMSSNQNNNQIEQIKVESALEETLIELVGDLAVYSPGKKMVFLEGENSEFDLKMIGKLFPEFKEKVNLISAGSKKQVIRIHNLLKKTATETNLKVKIFSITDKDMDDDFEDRPGGIFTWDVYHIENYLLNEHYLTEAIKSLTLNDSLSEKELSKLMVDCARESVCPLVNDKLKQKIWKDTFGRAKIQINPSDTNSARSIYRSLERNLEKISEVCNEEKLEELKIFEQKERELFKKSFQDKSWKSKIRGRDILKKMTSKIKLTLKIEKEISYEQLRNTVISTMARERHKPKGMEKIIQQIIDS